MITIAMNPGTPNTTKTGILSSFIPITSYLAKFPMRLYIKIHIMPRTVLINILLNNLSGTSNTHTSMKPSIISDAQIRTIPKSAPNILLPLIKTNKISLKQKLYNYFFSNFNSFACLNKYSYFFCAAVWLYIAYSTNSGSLTLSK